MAEPNTQYFARLLDRLRDAGPDRPELERQIVEAAYARAGRLARGILRGELRVPPAVETDDVVQEAMHDFSDQVAAIARASATPRDMFNQLCTIIRRRAVEEVRRRCGPKHRTMFPAATLDTGDEPATRPPDDALEVRLVINELVAGLPPDDQELVNLKYIEEWSYPELADHLGKTVEAVRWAVGRVLRRLERDAAVRIGRNPPPDRPPAVDP